MNLELFANTQKMFGSQSVLLHSLLLNMLSLLRTHFEQQKNIMVQTAAPFLPKIALAEELHDEAFDKFMQTRKTLTDSLHDSSGLEKLKKALDSSQKSLQEAKAACEEDQSGSWLPFSEQE